MVLGLGVAAPLPGQDDRALLGCKCSSSLQFGSPLEPSGLARRAARGKVASLAVEPNVRVFLSPSSPTLLFFLSLFFLVPPFFLRLLFRLLFLLLRQNLPVLFFRLLSLSCKNLLPLPLVMLGESSSYIHEFPPFSLFLQRSLFRLEVPLNVWPLNVGASRTGIVPNEPQPTQTRPLLSLRRKNF